MLGLDDDQDLVVGVPVVVLGGGTVVDRVEASSDRAIASRGILGGRDDGPRLGGIHDHRRHDAHGPAVEDHLDPLVLAGGNARQRNASGISDRAEHGRRGLDVDRAMLHVHGQPREPGTRHESRRRDAPQ